MEITLAKTGIKSWIPTKSFFKEMRSFFWLGVVISILGTLNGFADTFILGNVDQHALAAAFATDTIISFADGAIAGLAMAFISILSKKLNTSKFAEAQDGLDLLFFVTFCALVVVALILGFCAKPLLDIFHVQGRDALNYYYIMLASTFIYGYSSVVAQPLNATSDFKRRAIIGLVVLVSNVAMSVPLVYSAHLGIMGAGIGSLASYVFSMTIKVVLVKKRFKSDIKISPIRIFRAKLSHLKIIKKTWPTFITEVVNSATTFVSNMILARMFLDGAAVVAIAGVFFSVIMGLVNSGGPYQKYIGRDLENGDVEKCKRHGKGITTSVIIRILPFALLMVIFATILPYIHLYNVPDDIIIKARNTTYAFILVIPSMPFLMLGLFQAMLGGRPTITLIIQLAVNWLAILAIFIAGLYIDSIFWAAMINTGVGTLGCGVIYYSGTRPRNYQVDPQLVIEKK